MLSRLNGNRTFQAFASFLSPPVIAMLFLGFSAGLPLLLVGGTFTAWLRDLGVELATIGFLSWVSLAHSIKVFWAPIVDRMPLPLLTRLLGRRRAWMLVSQCCIAAALAAMAVTDPVAEPFWVAAMAVIAAFGSATQDIAIDAFRVEKAPPEQQATMAASYVTGYRVAILAAGAGALHIAGLVDWTTAYLSMAALMGVGVITTLIVSEPKAAQSVAARMPGAEIGVGKWLVDAVVHPFSDFFQRYGKASLAVLLFVATFRISDIFMGVMANPFYLDIGFTKAQIANIAAAFGLAMTLGGAALGGLMVARFGIARILLLTACLAPLTNLAFSALALMGPDEAGLTLAIVADNLTGGIAISVFIAYLSSLTNTAYTATQYALFSSLMTLPGHFFGGLTGLLAESVGWFDFYLISALTGLPAILLAILLLRVAHPDRPRRPASEQDSATGNTEKTVL